ncbi:MAG TPA: hypothetical protein PK867_13590, partial [Pirellulales bacterium]|nr:hypothetical protein [Pirellulales bacterium]
RATRLFQIAAAAGACTLMAGLWLAPQRTWANLLLLSFGLLGLGLGSLLWIALHHVTGARWSRPLLCVPEAMSSVLPISAAGLAIVLLFRPSLYPWSAPSFAHEASSSLQRFWLTRPFFLVRAVTYLASWLLFGALLARASRDRLMAADAAPRRKTLALSAAFLVVFGVTCWLASYDWIMSLEPKWASTIFGVYNFAGLFVSGLAAATLLIIWLRRHSSLQDVVTDDHLHDLGTLLFAFSSFWMYIWFCQYMVIWFANNPEETVYYLRRASGAWPSLAIANVVLGWGIPFLALLFRRAKRTAKTLGTVAVLILVGRWIDLYLMIFPSQGDLVPTPGPIEAGLLLGGVGVFGLTVFRALEMAPHGPGTATGLFVKTRQTCAKPHG